MKALIVYIEEQLNLQPAPGIGPILAESNRAKLQTLIEALRIKINTKNYNFG